MAETEIKPDIVLDAKGLCCPMPAVRTSLKLEDMTSGQILEVLTTDMASKRDMPAWCEGTGNRCLCIDTDADGVTHIFIQKCPVANA